jgi:hypothetical protein
MLPKRVIESAANYIASASRCKAAWEAAFEKSHEGAVLAGRDLVEMNSARLGLIWATHSYDLASALATMHYVEAAGSDVQPGPDHRHEQARRVLEARLAH